MDDNLQSELSLEDQVQVDAILNKRDRQRARKDGRIPAAFIGEEDDAELVKRLPRRSRHQAAANDEFYDENTLDPTFVLDDLKDRSIAQWVTMD